MARQTDAAWTRAEFPDIRGKGITLHYAGKKVPRESRQKVYKAQVVDGQFQIKKEIECHERNARWGKLQI